MQNNQQKQKIKADWWLKYIHTPIKTAYIKVICFMYVFMYVHMHDIACTGIHVYTICLNEDTASFKYSQKHCTYIWLINWSKHKQLCLFSWV